MTITTLSRRQAILREEKPPEHDINVEGIAPALIEVSRWVLWKWDRDKKSKWTKVPCTAHGHNCDAQNQNNWHDFATAERIASSQGFGIGFVFNGDGINGIDLDDCRDPDTGKLKGWAEDIINHLGTYCEVSPSGTGVKLFIRGTLPEKFDKQYDRPDDDGEVEIYSTGRFFTVTGQRVSNTPDDVRDRPAQLLSVLKLFQSWKPEKKSGGDENKKAQRSDNPIRTGDDDRATAMAALAVLDPNIPREQWIKTGMALHSVDSSTSMLGEWDQWSAGSQDRYTDGDCAKQWASFSGGGVGIGTLCHLADATGTSWRPTHHSGVNLDLLVDKFGQKGAFDTFDTSSTQGNGEKTESNQWSDPEPLPDDLPDVMSFDYELLPDKFRARVHDIATRMSCPPDFSSMSVIVASAAVIGRKVSIRPKRFDDWTVVCNLWGCAVGRPGLMKTSAIQQAIHPLRALAHDACEAHKRNSGELLATRDLSAMKVKRTRKEVQAALDSGDVDESVLKKQLSEARDLESEGGPPLRRYIVMDSTYEAVSDMLVESPNGFLQYRDELAGWWASLSREGQENARSFWLESWNGDSDYYIDRIGRGRMYVPSNTISVLGATQPGKLRSYLQGAIRGDSSDDGMVQRHQMLVWPDASSEWKQVDAWPDNHAKADVLEVFRRLDRLDPIAIGAIQEDGDDLPYLRFTPEAQVVFDEWLGQLERQLRSDRDPAHLESHFSKYRSLIPSLALIFHLIDEGQGAVGITAISRAIQWDDYLASHARRAYGGSHGATIDAAKKLLKRIADGELKDGFSIRNVYISHQAGLATKEEAQEAVDVLEDFGWLRSLKIKTDGRPSITCQLHPKISECLKGEGIKSIKSPPATPFDTFDTSPTQGNRDFGRTLLDSEIDLIGGGVGMNHTSDRKPTPQDRNQGHWITHKGGGGEASKVLRKGVPFEKPQTYPATLERVLFAIPTEAFMPKIKRASFRCPLCGATTSVMRTRDATASGVVRYRRCLSDPTHRVTTREFAINAPTPMAEALGSTSVKLILRTLCDELGINIESPSPG